MIEDLRGRAAVVTGAAAGIGLAAVAAVTRDLAFVATDPGRRDEVEQRGAALLAAFDVVLDRTGDDGGDGDRPTA